jgi:hypothetical protein
MFDIVKCECDLPLPEDLGECTDIDWSEFEFKTASFDGALDEYEVTIDGELYHWKIDREWQDDESHPMGGSLQEMHRELKRLDWTGELVIHGVHLPENNDYLFEFKLIFFEGHLKNIERVIWNVQDSSERKEMQQKMEHFLKEQMNLREKWWFGLYSIWSFFIKFLCSSARWVFNGLARLFYKLEGWLT